MEMINYFYLNKENILTWFQSYNVYDHLKKYIDQISSNFKQQYTYINLKLFTVEFQWKYDTTCYAHYRC